MLFFTRAFLCIGAVVILAKGVDTAGLLRDTRTATGALAPAALAPVAALCRSRPDTCLAIATAAARAEPGERSDAADQAAPVRVRSAIARRGPDKLPELSSRPRVPR